VEKRDYIIGIDVRIILNWKLKETGYEDVDGTPLPQDTIPTGRRVT
jgi:hypothetical protein